MGDVGEIGFGSRVIGWGCGGLVGAVGDWLG